jgi:hypothetical protein
MTAHRKGQPPLRRVRSEPRSTESGVGYRKPPAQHRFQPGQSGNLRGRPKGAKNESTVLREILARKIEVRSDGRMRKITILEAILLRVTEDSLKGNIKSAAFLLNRYAAMVSGELPIEGIGEDDREVLEAYAKRLQRRTNTESEEE